MLNSLFDYWKSFTTLGTLSLPLVGLFFLGSKVTGINWSSPLGYYTKLRLFIKRNGGGPAQATASTGSGGQVNVNNQYQLVQVSSSSSTSNSNEPDLIAEYPITSLDKESWWKYCLPQKSKLKKNGVAQTTSSLAPAGEECKLNWYKRGSDELNYLLRLGLKFLKLQHQINLMLFYHSDSKKNEQEVPRINDPTDNSGWKSQFQQKCEVKQKSNGESILKDFFVSTSPVSPHCLLVPNKVDLTLTISNGAEKVGTDSNSQAEVKLTELKKGSMEGNIEYSFSNYYGKLHDFSWQNGALSSTTNGHSANNNPVLISLKSASSDKKFEFKLESSDTSSNNGQTSLDFEKLYKKYEQRELKLCDFWKSTTTGAGGGQQSNMQFNLSVSKSIS